MAYMFGTFGQKPFADYGIDAAEAARRARGRQKAEALEAEFSRDMQNLTRLLTQNIDAYGSSEDAGDRQMAKLYAEYLAMLQEPKGRYRAVREYRKGLIPGIGAPRQAQMPPAWS